MQEALDKLKHFQMVVRIHHAQVRAKLTHQVTQILLEILFTHWS